MHLELTVSAQTLHTSNHVKFTITTLIYLHVHKTEFRIKSYDEEVDCDCGDECEK